MKYIELKTTLGNSRCAGLTIQYIKDNKLYNEILYSKWRYRDLINPMMIMEGIIVTSNKQTPFMTSITNFKLSDELFYVINHGIDTYNMRTEPDYFWYGYQADNKDHWLNENWRKLIEMKWFL